MEENDLLAVRRQKLGQLYEHNVAPFGGDTEFRIASN